MDIGTILYTAKNPASTTAKFPLLKVAGGSQVATFGQQKAIGLFAEQTKVGTVTYYKIRLFLPITVNRVAERYLFIKSNLVTQSPGSPTTQYSNANTTLPVFADPKTSSIKIGTVSRGRELGTSEGTVVDGMMLIRLSTKLSGYSYGWVSKSYASTTQPSTNTSGGGGGGGATVVDVVDDIVRQTVGDENMPKLKWGILALIGLGLGYIVYKLTGGGKKDKKTTQLSKAGKHEHSNVKTHPKPALR